MNRSLVEVGMRPFLVAFGHLLWRSLTGLVGGWMATSLAAIGVGIVNYLVAPRIDAIIHGEKTAKKPRITGSLVLTIATWLLLYASSVVYTVYTDHARLVTENTSLLSEIGTKDQVIHQYAVSVIDCANRLKSLTTEEAEDSLRRRTFRLADEFARYIAKAQQNKPPDASPSSSDPNPTEERKKAMELSRAYYKTIEDHYFMHFRDRFVGIIREYNTKGVRTGNFEIDFDKRVPSIAQEGSFFYGMDDLTRFRDLAYHVDAKDHLITF
jgi:hypothetical protein